MVEVIPAELLRSERKDDFLAWLRNLRLDPEDKKQLLIIWADKVNTELTSDMIRRAGIE